MIEASDAFRLLGRVRVEGSELRLVDCQIDAGVGERLSGGRAQVCLGLHVSDRALSIVGGRVFLARCTLSGRTAGAVGVHAADATFFECAITDSRAPCGVRRGLTL
eukprot:5536121-Prymnesium_polylepis.1